MKAMTKRGTCTIEKQKTIRPSEPVTVVFFN